MINLMFCGNSKVFDGMIISLLSIVKYTKEPLNVFVLTMDLRNINEDYTPIEKKHIDILEDIIKEKNSDSKITLIDTTELIKKEVLSSVNQKTHYTPYIFIRLFSDKIEELPDKILYLDCDIVCYKDIKEIFDIDIEEYDVGVVKDYIGRKVINRKYINSGVLLINLKKVREDGSFEKARNIAKKRVMAMPDQTAIYKACTKKLYLPDKYNEQKERKEDTVIRHFSMTVKLLPYFRLVNIKPWNIDRMHNEYKIFDYEDILEKYLEIKNKETGKEKTVANKETETV